MDFEEQLTDLFNNNFKGTISSIDKLQQSGSNRKYFRLHYINDADKPGTLIGTISNNIKENDTFIKFAGHFKNAGCPVPKVFCVNKDLTAYLQEDFGDVSLINALEKNGETEEVFELFSKSLKALAHMQIKGHEGLNYDWCITSKEFGKQAILSDLLYFKYYFLDTLEIPYDKEKLIEDFEALANYLSYVRTKFFMFRDFQSRNIYVKDGEVHFIDFQGGMQGALQYDVASLLWQARANLSDDWKNRLLEKYMDYATEFLEREMHREQFELQYNGYVLIRLLQVMGAYGFRGLFERKAHFLTSIPLALRNIKWFLKNKKPGISLPVFEELLDKITADEVIARFEPVKATKETPLVVTINSFSFLKRGYPKDVSTNGGGHVFDCRGILNPGRIEEFKTQTGRDSGVKKYLEEKTTMPKFLNHAYDIVDISIENYMQRGFENLSISFGCTGGQHRSVYAADAMARHLRNKYGVKINVHHLEQGIDEVSGS